MHRRHFGEPEPDPVGTVRGPDQRPVPRGQATVPGPAGRRLVSTLTDARGEYAATALPEGRPPRAGGVVRADLPPRDRTGTGAGHV
ncbi:carboxypeptidase-like regulatory domain-containing protein [Streptomyces sp. NPDC014983]|uniref:carboxypeptidase-like regulatory domain-containing protein n=1 Tax=Streptomyces sp. NPDC014983 TaxID=3364933 RepID=UPI0036F5E77A